MKRILAFACSVSLAMFTFACQQPQAEAPEASAPPEETAAAPETGPDPTVADPDHYSVDDENDRMRIVRIQYGPGEESSMHYHPAGMAVFLTASKASLELPDGTVQEIEVEAGQSMLLPGGQHKPKNLLDEPFEVVQVELKDASGTEEPAEGETGSDPTVEDPDHYTVEHEDDRMRVVRIKYGAGEESVMHYHPAGAAVFLTAAKGSFELPDGSTQPIEAEAGQAMLLPAGQHKPKNLGEAFEVVQVELKD